MTKPISEFEAVIRRYFYRPALLTEALTHSSYLNETEVEGRDNERLEFLGDAIVDFIAGEMLFRMYPDASEGYLTQLRSALVRADSLAIMAEKLHIGEFVRLGHGEEVTGGRTRVNILADTFEAVTGAVYLDGGLEAVRQFLEPQLQELLVYILANDLHRDARSVLQERAQGEFKVTPIYRVAEEIGKEHEREYVIEVVVRETVLGVGRASNKRVASQLAARHAIEMLNREGWPEALQTSAGEALPDDAQPPDAVS
jgi:ribonuclease-3